MKANSTFCQLKKDFTFILGRVYCAEDNVGTAGLRIPIFKDDQFIYISTDTAEEFGI